jgi:hypothetical protein
MVNEVGNHRRRRSTVGWRYGGAVTTSVIGEAPVDGDSGRGHHGDEGNMSNPIGGPSAPRAH